jgi:hypothetical protein
VLPIKTACGAWTSAAGRRQNATYQAMPNTESERAFQRYMDNRRIAWEFEPEVPGRSKRPDYRIRHEGEEIFLDVKEFAATRPPSTGAYIATGGAYDKYSKIREKINAGKRKFKEYKEYSCSLVLFDCGAFLLDLDDERLIFAAMTLPPKTGPSEMRV